MVKILTLILSISLLIACSFSSDNQKLITNLPQHKIDQKSHATSYAATIQTYSGRIHKDYNVNNFIAGVNDWYLKRILLSAEQIKQSLYQGSHDSNIYAYYSGVLFASALQQNFNKLNPNCWKYIEQQSVVQGISDAMRDLQTQKVRSLNDDYFIKGTEEVLTLCTTK